MTVALQWFPVGHTDIASRWRKIFMNKHFDRITNCQPVWYSFSESLLQQDESQLEHDAVDGEGQEQDLNDNSVNTSIGLGKGCPRDEGASLSVK